MPVHNPGPALRTGPYIPSFCPLCTGTVSPAVGLRLLELGGGKAPFLAVFDTEIFFFGLVLPFSLFIQWAHRQQNMGMGIVPRRIWVVDSSISAHPVCHELLLDEILQELNLFLSAQFCGQRRHKFTGQAAGWGGNIPPHEQGIPKWKPLRRLPGQGWQFGRNTALSSGSRRSRNPPRRAHVPDQQKGYHRLL